MTPDELREIKASRCDWREADLHDLRTRYAALLLSIAIHKRDRTDEYPKYQASPADFRLWALMKENGFGKWDESSLVA